MIHTDDITIHMIHTEDVMTVAAETPTFGLTFTRRFRFLATSTIPTFELLHIPNMYVLTTVAIVRITYNTL